MRKIRAVIWAVCLLLPVACAAQEPKAAVRAEVQRLKSVMVHTGEGDTWKEIKPMASESLTNCEAALDRGRLYLAVMELARAQRLIVSASYGDGPTMDSASFERRWTEERASLAKFTSAEQKTWDAPLAIRALEEAARGQVMPTVDAGKAYAPVTEIKYGQFYLGDAQALADFSRFVREFRFEHPGASPKVRSVAPELRALQAKANAAFKPPLSRDKHAQFIRLNSTLKTAEELEGAGLHAGAWYEYLTAIIQYSALQAPDVDASKQNSLKDRIADELQKPAPSGEDDSLRRLFLEQAESAVAKDKPTAADLSRASLILDKVLPGYEELVKGAPKDAAPAAPLLATVTLVRWPYT